MTVGLALLLQPTVGAVGAAFVLGLLVGLAKLPRLATLDLVFPIVVTFVVSVMVFATLQHVQIDNPVRILIPPLVTFLPGAALTIATVELAAGQMVSGASRLVNGLVQLLLLAFGILAASALFELCAAVLADNPVNRLGWWAPWLGVVVFAVGMYLHLSAPARSLPWMLVIMLAAYAGQVAGAAVFGGLLSGFFGALAMTPLALWVETVRNGPPKLVTFLPGFWLLVPGAAGLIGVTATARRRPSAGGPGDRRHVGHGDVHRPRGAHRHSRLPHHRLRTPCPGHRSGLTAAKPSRPSVRRRAPGGDGVWGRSPHGGTELPPGAGWGAATRPINTVGVGMERSSVAPETTRTAHAERSPGRVHRCRGDGRRRDLRPPRLGRRGGRGRQCGSRS